MAQKRRLPIPSLMEPLFFFSLKPSFSWGKLLLLQVNNENFWIAALAVVAYVLFAGNVCCYNGSHNQSRPEIFKRTP